MAADMISSEMRAYAPATVDARWAVQVSSLTRGIWWGNDADYLSAIQGSDVRAPYEIALELFHAFAHLRALPSVCPLPGTARAAGPGVAALGEADERILGKIRALLAKAESTEFPDEAEALSARAQELMAKYSIDRALVAAQAGSKDEPAGCRLHVDNPYESPKASLLQTVAAANRCRAVWHKELGLSTVVGFRADLDVVELLFTSLLVQANTAMLRSGAKRDAHGRSRTRAFRQSFLVAYSVRIGERLSDVAGHVEQEATAQAGGQSLLPVLARRRQAVDDAVNDLFGDALTEGRGVHATDSEGWYSGRAAADLATLHNRDQLVT
jgi:hypothetical protein